jgi:hypothetical protein
MFPTTINTDFVAKVHSRFLRVFWMVFLSRRAKTQAQLAQPLAVSNSRTI